MKPNEDLATSFRRWYDSDHGRAIWRIEANCAFSLYTPKMGEMVIDIGCGTGQFSRELVKRGARVVGIDTDRGVIDDARSLDDHGLYRVMDMHELDYPDNYFDAAVSTFALEFSDNPATVIHEAIRVVKPGGDVLFGTIQRGSAYADAYTRRGEAGEIPYAQAHFYTKAELLAMIPKGDVSVAECIGFGPDDAVTEETTENVAGVVFVTWKKSIG